MLCPWSSINCIWKCKSQASLAAQWWGIYLPMQETWVQFLVREDPTCGRATEPMHHNYWACALEPGSLNCWSPSALEPALWTREATATSSPCTTIREQRLASATIEKPSPAMKTQHNLKQINQKNFKRKCKSHNWDRISWAQRKWYESMVPITHRAFDQWAAKKQSCDSSPSFFLLLLTNLWASF